jgi:hypothetical protein
VLVKPDWTLAHKLLDAGATVLATHFVVCVLFFVRHDFVTVVIISLSTCVSYSDVNSVTAMWKYRWLSWPCWRCTTWRRLCSTHTHVSCRRTATANANAHSKCCATPNSAPRYVVIYIHVICNEHICVDFLSASNLSLSFSLSLSLPHLFFHQVAAPSELSALAEDDSALRASLAEMHSASEQCVAFLAKIQTRGADLRATTTEV